MTMMNKWGDCEITVMDEVARRSILCADLDPEIASWMSGEMSLGRTTGDEVGGWM